MAGSGQGQLVSVVIPAFNSAATIAATLRSVAGQTHEALEIIVVDDGSTDATPETVEQFARGDARVRLVRQPNTGPSAARNTGIARATADLIAPLDADDLWHPTKLEKQLARLRQGGDEVGMVACWGRAMDMDGRVLYDLARLEASGHVLAHLLARNTIDSGMPLMRRSVVEAAGGYDTRLAHSEDLKLNLAIAARTRVAVVPEYLKAYRMRPGSQSAATLAMRRGHDSVIADARARFPDLPARLYSWSAALHAWEQARCFARQGEWLEAMHRLADAIASDPLGAAREGTGLVRRRLRGAAVPDVPQAHFLDMDTRSPSRPFVSEGFLSPRRMRAIARMEQHRAGSA